MRVRKANSSDIASMMGLERESPAAAHWSQQQYESLFQESVSKELERFACVVEEDESGQSKGTASDSRKVIGFLVGRRLDMEWELENIAVAAAVRRRGLGGVMLREFISHTQAAEGKNIFLEVRESNMSARAFYGKFGFAEAGLRKKYYSMPPEDAVLYRRPIG